MLSDFSATVAESGASGSSPTAKNETTSGTIYIPFITTHGIYTISVLGVSSLIGQYYKKIIIIIKKSWKSSFSVLERK